MIIKLCFALLILPLGYRVSTLDHEKSFLLLDDASTVRCVALYKDSLLLTSTNDVIQKDIETGATQRTFRSHMNLVYFFMVTSDSRLITSGFDGMIIVWDLENGSVLKRIWLGSSNTLIHSFVLVNDIIYTCGPEKKIRQVDLIAGRLVKTVDMTTIIYSAVTDGSYLYAGTNGGTVQIEKIHIPTLNLQLVFEGHRDYIMSIYLTDLYLFSGSFDPIIISWNPENGELLRTYLGHTSAPSSFIVVENELFSGGLDRNIIKWNILSGEILKILPIRHGNQIHCMTRRNDTFFSGSEDTTIIRWNITTDMPIFTYSSHNKKLRPVVSWKSFVISGGEDSKISLWETTSNSIIAFAFFADHMNSVNCLLLQKDNLFSGSTDRTIRQWDLNLLTCTMIFNGHSSSVSSITGDSLFLYSAATDYTMIKWNTTSGDITNLFYGHSDIISFLQVFSDVLYSASFDSTLKTWDTETSTIISTYATNSKVYSILVQENSVILGLNGGLLALTITSQEKIIELEENSNCFYIISRGPRVYTAQHDSLIKARDSVSLYILESYIGHQDSVFAICFDETGTLYSSSFDGTIKKWNMASRKVAFSFENRNGSVTALAAADSLLFIGNKNGALNCFSIEDSFLVATTQLHKGELTSLIIVGNHILSTGNDGVFAKSTLSLDNTTVQMDSRPSSVKCLGMIEGMLFMMRGENEIVFIHQYDIWGSVRTIITNTPLTSIAANEEYVLAGARSGIILGWDLNSLELDFNLKGHTSQINFLLVDKQVLFSCSDDKSIIQWSLDDRAAAHILKRYSSVALGHLGPVNSLSVCHGFLFSAGFDNSVRKWNTLTAKHQDVYFGFSKMATSVLCYNKSVFAGSEDFSVLMFRPTFKLDERLTSTLSEITNSKTKGPKKAKIVSLENPRSEFLQKVILPVVIVLILLLGIIAFGIILIMKKSKLNARSHTSSEKAASEMGTTITDLDTVVNSVVGISKHAACLIENSAIAQVKKITSGGGGELFLAKIMDPSLRKKHGDIVIQKIIFIRNKASEVAFYQEVGIMIMLSTFPHFCQIVGYTENPLSMILKYYADGSLSDWLSSNRSSAGTGTKVLIEIAKALDIMHSHYLAHCDVKPQNVLVEIVNGIPSCFLTDFGIAQVLSDKIIATKSFNVMNLRGLSVHYASPDAFTAFHTKNYTRIDFKRYDVYSFACVSYEVFSGKPPWHKS